MENQRGIGRWESVLERRGNGELYQIHRKIFHFQEVYTRVRHGTYGEPCGLLAEALRRESGLGYLPEQGERTALE